MTAALPRLAAAGLRRIALLTAILAVLAGFLGMHVIAGTHSAHALSYGTSTMGTAAASTGDTAQGHATAGHAASTHPADAGPTTHLESPAPPSCLCGGDCGGQSTAHASCTPAPPGASLSAPAPGSALPTVPYRTAPPADRAAATAHVPASPTPGDLSISRT